MKRLRDLLLAALGAPSEHARYEYLEDRRPAEGRVALDWGRGRHALTREAVAAFAARQTFPALQWGDTPSDTPAPPSYFYAPTRLPEVPPAFLEAAWLVAAAEKIDAVVLGEREPGFRRPDSWEDILQEPWRSLTLFRAAAFEITDPGEIRPRQRQILVKVLGGERPLASRYRRWDYLANYALGYRPAFGLRRTRGDHHSPQPPGKKRLLVTVPFFARGGVEHTLLETLRHLPQIEPLFVSLAPHRPELGDRRADFEKIGPRLLPLGDLVHPAAMPDILDHLLETYRPFAWYNANGTTLFYDFVARIKRDWPQLRILDHLYDHRVGYIDRYSPALLDAVDACIAENARISQCLQEDYGWPAARVPVVWPCGRAHEDLPSNEEATRARREIRQRLGIAETTTIFLMAARMHEQKRPLDVPQLALRTRDLPVFFLMLGGGDLEGQVDDAIAAARAEGAAVLRLPFQENIPEWIAAADVGTLVSAYEGLPIFLLECLQLGKPFLGTDVGALGDVLRDTGAGWVVEKPGDLEALEAQVRAILQGTAWENCANAAREAGPRFDVAACAERYLAVFEGQA